MQTRRLVRSVVVGIILLSVITAPVVGADWPMYGYNAARSGASPEQLKIPLHLQWVYVPKHAPQPAWPEPGRERHRLAFDYAYQVVVANGSVYFGSSADHKVYALDLSTGQERWHFFTDAPVRFAPAVEGERVFVASDDGWLYCLSATDGKLLWRFYGGLRDERLLGNEQMISRWPLRSGVAVEDGIVYFTAGMWPAEGVYVYALRAADGTVIWKNDTSGHMYITQPHVPAMAMTGVAPQGYIVAHEDMLFVPTGRNVPAAYNRNTGQFLYYWSLAQSQDPDLHHPGGSWVFAAAKLFFGWYSNHWGDMPVRLGESPPRPGDGLITWDCQTGQVTQELPGKDRAVVSGEVLYASGSGKVSAYDLPALLAGTKPAECTKWETLHDRAYALILAGERVVVGGQDTVTTIATTDGDNLCQNVVDGQVRGLAAADGRLLASTSTGQIVCFGPQQIANPPMVSPSIEGSAYPNDRLTSAARAMARRVIKETGKATGYCLVLGAGDGRLAYELAKQSDLKIYWLDPDAQKVATAREALDAAGLYGVRVTVHCGSLQKLPYPDYFANLIVLGDGIEEDLENCSAQELYRMLRPCGGTAYIVTAEGAAAAKIDRWLQGAGVPSADILTSETAVQVVRGKLPGAGQWTHQYADAGRSGASDDQLVKLPLKLLWFGKPGPAKMVNRHWRGPAPLSTQGRLFAIGQHSITAVDAYNGRELWCRDLPRVGRFPWVSRSGGVDQKASNVVADDDSVYVALGTVCLRLNAETGETEQTYHLPPPPESLPAKLAESLTWEYIAQNDDLVFGSMGSESQGWYIFGVNKDDGKPRWIYAAEEAVHHDAIAVGEGRVYLLDRTSAAEIDKMKRRGKPAVAKSTLLALDAATGETVWSTDNGLPERTQLFLAQDVLLSASRVPWAPSGLPWRTFGGGRMRAWSANNGRLLWAHDVQMARFPVIVGDTIYGEPYAYDLHTGELKQRAHPLTEEQVPCSFERTYGCGSVSGAPTMLLFRSGTLGFCDLAGDSGIHNFGGVRAGCYVNAIAANGLVLMPPGDAGCTCSYNYKTTIALTPTTRNEEWSVFPAVPASPATRIQHVAVNFGVPGDRRDADGQLWVAFPRPAGLVVPLETEISAEGGYYRHNSDELVVQGTNSPWLYASGCRGLRSATLALFPRGPSESPETAPKSYMLRLHFAELEKLEAGPTGL